jgi:hypothetical protein
MSKRRLQTALCFYKPKGLTTSLENAPAFKGLPPSMAVVRSATLFDWRRALLTEIRLKTVKNSLADDHRAFEPPDPIPNSEVKRSIADGSVGFPHVRVGHCQPLN